MSKTANGEDDIIVTSSHLSQSSDGSQLRKVLSRTIQDQPPAMRSIANFSKFIFQLFVDRRNITHKLPDFSVKSYFYLVRAPDF